MAASAKRPRQGQGEPAKRLTDGDAAANWRVAGSAAAPLRQVADHWDQLVRGQAAATGPAVGRWPQEGLPAWDAIQHDFEEAAQRRPERKQEGCAEQVAHDVHQWQLLASALSP